MRWGLALAALVACKGGGERKKIARSDRDAPAVAVVDRAGGAAGAADRPAEREPDDDADHAMPLADGVRGALDGETDVDVYAITADGPRLLAARLGPMAGVDGVLELRDDAFALIMTGDRGGAGVGEGFPNISLDKGRYFLVVRELVRRGKPKKGADAAAAGRTGPAPYELTAALSADPPPGGEREPDDDAGSANEVTLGEPVTGYIGWGGDVDVWKLSVEGFADGDGLDVTVGAVDKVALTVEVTDAGGRRLIRSTGAPGQPVTLRSLAPRVAPGEPTVQFIAVAGKPANPDVTYQLAVTSRLLELDEEAEPNDDRGNPLRYGSEEQGTMKGELGPGDVDRFELSPPSSAASFDVVVDAPAGVDLVLEVTGAASAKADRGGAGAGEQLVGVTVPAGSALGVRVSARPDKKGAAGAYQLRWSLSEPSAPPMPSEDDPMPPEE